MLLLSVASSSFGQVFSDNLNYADASLLTANGWTAHSGTTNAIDVGASNGLTYAGYSGVTGTTGSIEGNAALLDNTGEDVNKPFAADVTSGTLYYSFLVNVASGDAGYFTHLGKATNFAARVFVKPSANPGKINFGISNTGTASFATTPTDFDLNTTYLIIVKYDVSTAGAASIWVKATGVPASEAAAGTPEHTTAGSGQATIGGVYLRQYAATQNITIDALLVYSTWFGEAPCALAVGNGVAVCDAATLNFDTYTVSFAYTGGNSGTYNLSSNVGTIGGDNPSTTADGTITISNITEGQNVTLTVSGACNFTKFTIAPECKPINPLPFKEPFDYAVGTSLASTQTWSNTNAGDTIDVISDSLTYPNYPASGNSVSYVGIGSDPSVKFTVTTAGTIYTSFLINVTDISTVTTDLSETVIAAVTGDSPASFRARLFFKKNGTQYQLGCTTATTTTPAAYDTNLLNVGSVVAVVIGYDFTANELKMWVNPDFSTFSNATPATVTEVPATALTNLGGFILRQDSAALTPAISFDELRIAETTAALLSVSQNNIIAGLEIYPNPVSNGTLFINTNANAEKNIAIFNVLGKEVFNTTTANNAVNVATLNSGVYILKITEAGKTATSKLVVR